MPTESGDDLNRRGNLEAPATPTIGSASPPRVANSNSGELSGGSISYPESNSKCLGSDEAQLEGGDRPSWPSTYCANRRQIGDIVVMPVEDEQENSEDKLCLKTLRARKRQKQIF
ncbi:hypothetical protein M3Y98_00503200 [Aphelenchoides besseyi]|nr:hypothetical protein M3Y98_00503200 [Aphelenchoides besseyi]KAI6207776.1 hypothetical protein M3Y96_00044700 [Aphelenchoides besseyi]